MTTPGEAAGGRLSDRLGTATRLAIGALPDGVKRRLAGPYNRVQTVRADREFGRRSLPDREPAQDAPRHVVCVVVDALRADAVCRADSPFLAERLHASPVTPAPWTFPAVSSLVTGRYPHEHGAMRQSDRADRGATDLVVPPELPDEETTLPEAFAGAGYDTYGAFGFHMPFFALGGRFASHALYDKADAGTVVDGYLGWLDGRADHRTLSYLHLGDLHEPVVPPVEYARRYDVDTDIPDLERWDYEAVPEVGSAGERYREHRRRLYRAAVAYVDDQLERLRDRLRDRLEGDPVLVVTADHGEGFWEHAVFDAARFVDSRPAYCVDHGGTPYECIARVPLAVEGLDLAPVEDAARPASLVDLAPTLLDAIGLPEGLPASGRSLASRIPPGRTVLVEATRYGHERKAVYRDGWKLLVSRADDEAVGFALPREVPTDLPADVEADLASALPPWPDGERPDVRVSGLARDRLEDLGYV